jgi:hypothetical protein
MAGLGLFCPKITIAVTMPRKNCIEDALNLEEEKPVNAKSIPSRPTPILNWLCTTTKSYGGWWCWWWCVCATFIFF